MKAAIAITAASAAMANAVASPANANAAPTKRASSNMPTVSVKGNAFWAGDERFYIRGVDYQPGGSSGEGGSGASDPLADSSCEADIKKFKELGINTVRIYTVDNSKNHDHCMSLLADAGIYLALDVNSPDYSLNRDDPAASYNDAYLQSVFATIDAFQKYDNTLLFFSGNEVINADNTTDCAPYIKAVTRDMKQYIGSQGYRKIPVGYSAADVESNRQETAAYMNCGPDDQRSDFFAFNDYSWCDPSSFTTSGWDQKVQQFKGYSLPLFFSEYGCITNKRTFQEVPTLYSEKMTGVYSGGLAYEFSEEGSGYGIVKINGKQISEKPDFDYLKNAFSKAKVPSGDGGYSANGKPSQCPKRSPHWEVKDFTGTQLPSIPDGAKKFMSQGAGKAPGLSGPGSQNAGGTSTGTASAGSGQVSETSSSKPSSAAVPGLTRGQGSLKPFVACGAAVFLGSLLGAAVL